MSYTDEKYESYLKSEFELRSTRSEIDKRIQSLTMEIHHTKEEFHKFLAKQKAFGLRSKSIAF